MNELTSPHKKIGESFVSLVSIIEKLRSPGGCPWDAKQTHKSLKPNILEEVYELLEAIEKNNSQAILEELGDILLQVIFHAEIARTSKEFDVQTVCEKITSKMIKRHPHVFSKNRDKFNVKKAEDVEDNWESFKRSASGQNRSIVASLPVSMPALAFAAEIKKRAKRCGIPDDTAIRSMDGVTQEEQAGLKLLDDVNEIIQLGVDPESALKATVTRLRDRIVIAEKLADDKPLSELSKDELQRVWIKSDPNFNSQF